jgi:hypothetical protein
MPVRLAPEAFGVVAEKARFFGSWSRNILDKKAPGARFNQCLQGFRVIKKPPTMGCTVFVLCAIMRKQSWNYEGRMQKCIAGKNMDGQKNKEKPIFLPSPSSCLSSAGRRTASQPVAAIRRKDRAKLMSLLPFRGHSIGVNSPGQARQSGLPHRRWVKVNQSESNQFEKKLKHDC